MSQQIHCEFCGRAEYEDRGLWRDDPPQFYCSYDCIWDAQEFNEELDDMEEVY